MERLSVFGKAFCGLLVILPWAAAHATAPNIVFFLADDLGYNDLAAHGNPFAKTPQLDRFATDAVAFSRYYTAPVCNPARAALMTGRVGRSRQVIRPRCSGPDRSAPRVHTAASASVRK